MLGAKISKKCLILRQKTSKKQDKSLKKRFLKYLILLIITEYLKIISKNPKVFFDLADRIKVSLRKREVLGPRRPKV